jgi:large conductance mechanosensitive channel
MFKGFREFLLRGNVIDLAVAVVIGTAFTAIVTAIVGNVLNPALGALFQADSLNNAIDLELPTTGDEPAVIRFGAVLAAIINFVLVAAVVYFALVMPINWLKKNAFQKKEQGRPAVAKDTPPTELELLSDIRDLLAAGATPEQRAGTEGRHAAAVPPASAND